jgi:hypothetical protein
MKIKLKIRWSGNYFGGNTLANRFNGMEYFNIQSLFQGTLTTGRKSSTLVA